MFYMSLPDVLTESREEISDPELDWSETDHPCSRPTVRPDPYESVLLSHLRDLCREWL